MSDRIKARLDSLEKRYTKPTYAFEDMPKPPVPLADMSKEWQDQYHKDPNMISMIWQRVVREYHEAHIQAWLDSERRTPTLSNPGHDIYIKRDLRRALTDNRSETNHIY